jgi:hypothetical protein
MEVADKQASPLCLSVNQKHHQNEHNPLLITTQPASTSHSSSALSGGYDVIAVRDNNSVLDATTSHDPCVRIIR